MSDEQLQTERNRFLVLNLVRISGALLLVFSLAVISRGFLGIPKEAGYVLLLVGIADFIAAPLVLARAWKSKTDL